MNKLTVAIAVVCLIAVVNAGLVTNLPGLTFTPNFNQYAGYITVNATHGRALHYCMIIYNE